LTAAWDEARDVWGTVAATVEHHRQWMIPSLRARRLWLRRANVPVVVTGLAGTGKTVLRDALLGRSGGLDYRTERSADWERDRVLFRAKAASARVGLLVVPGQDSTERERAIEAAAGGRNAPVGWVHVVSWGYHEIWRGEVDKGLAELDWEPGRSGNDTVRAYFLQREIDDFRDVCDLIKRPAVQDRLEWLVIAVAKCDLFWDRLDEARDHYLPSAAGPVTGFHDELNGLTAGDRRVPPQIMVVPFSGSPQSHRYHETLPPTPARLDDVQARALRNGFYDVLRRLL
jgi:hypothetical protein